MIFTGTGSVWNPVKNKALVNFNKTPEYETTDKVELDILEKCPTAKVLGISGIESEDIEFTIEDENNEVEVITETNKNKLAKEIREKGLSTRAQRTLEGYSVEKLQNILKGGE